MRDAFSGYHPAVNFIYFGAVIVFSMFLMHPVFLGISFAAAFCYSLCLKGYKGFGFNIKFIIPMLLFIVIINPLFNHEGITILTYLPSGNPLTLESIVYGLAAAGLMVCVIQWFYCYTFVMTSDKFVFLFGRIIPSLSLVLSMTLRFVPRFIAQFKTVRQAQRCIGHDISNGNFIQKVKNSVKILSVMISWTMENAIETSDSMKSRGYGLSKRSSFSIYKFEKRDKFILSFILCLFLYVLISVISGKMDFYYFPKISGNICGMYQTTVYIAYFLLCFIPVIIHVKENRKWKLYQSKI